VPPPCAFVAVEPTPRHQRRAILRRRHHHPSRGTCLYRRRRRGHWIRRLRPATIRRTIDQPRQFRSRQSSHGDLVRDYFACEFEILRQRQDRDGDCSLVALLIRNRDDGFASRIRGDRHDDGRDVRPVLVDLRGDDLRRDGGRSLIGRRDRAGALILRTCSERRALTSRDDQRSRRDHQWFHWLAGTGRRRRLA
jgi:hypothetical protein